MKNLNISNKNKNLIFIIILASFISSRSYGCDVCGCGLGNYYLNNISMFQKNFAGLRYRFMSFDSHLKMHQSLRSSERFQTAEFVAGYYLTPKIQLMAFVPYSYNLQHTQSQTKYLNGLSDMSIMGNYQLYLSPTDTTMRIFTHNVRLGGGLKLPTGAYVYQSGGAGQVANPNFQLGSGSTDFLASLIYTIRYKKLGLNTDITYKINTANRQKYSFGNRLNSNIALFALLQASKKCIVMPSLGLYGEKSVKDKQNQELITNSGGILCATSLGLDFYIAKKVMIGCNYQAPFYQNLADGQINANPRIMAQVQYMF